MTGRFEKAAGGALTPPRVPSGAPQDPISLVIRRALADIWGHTALHLDRYRPPGVRRGVKLMFDLSRFSLNDLIECSRALRQLGREERSMEGVADRIVHYLHDQLVDGQSGTRACVLVRLFKTHPHGGLDEDLQRFASALLGRPPESPSLKCLTLLATAGDRPEWNHRQQSRGHQAIPLSSAEGLQRAPMIDQLIQQFGLEASALLRPDPAVLLDLEQRTYNVFHVPQARGSPLVPAQDEFVVPFGVESVLGFGGMLPGGDLFAVILFSRVPIPRTTADLFRPLALSVKLAVLPFDGGPVFAPARPAAAAIDGAVRENHADEEAARSRSRASTLEQLLEVHEQSLLTHAVGLEQVLSETRQQLESVPDAIIITDDQGRIVRINRQVEAAFGYSREELLGRPAELLVPQGFRPRDGVPHARGGPGLGPRTVGRGQNLYGRRKDGSEFPVDLSLSPLGTADGVRVIGIIHDITARRRAERRLATQLAMTRVLAEAATLAEATPKILQAVGAGLGWDYAAFWRVDHQARVLRCVETWHRPAVEVPGFDALTRATTWAPGIGFPGRIWADGRPARIADLTREGDFSRTPPAADEGLRSAYGFPIRFRGEVLGVIELFSREVEPIDDEQLAMMAGLGSQLGLFIERKRFEEQLLKISHAVEQSASLVIISDADGRIEYVNPKFTQVTGYTPEEVVGENPRLLKSGKTPPQDYQRLWSTINAGGEWRGEFQNKRKNGELYWVSASISPVRNPQGIITHFVAIQEDITELKRAEEALRRAHEELEQQVRRRTAALVRTNEALLKEIAERQKAETALRGSEERLRFFVENTPAAVAMFDRDMRFLLVSRRWLTDYGLGDQDIIGRTLYEVFPEIPEHWRKSHRRVLAGEVLRSEEDPFLRKDGRVDWVRWEDRPWRDSRGEIGGMIMFTEVITERKRAEQHLRWVDRARRALVSCNQALIRARDESQFLQDLCRVIVEDAGYRMCWVGYAEHDEAKTVRPMAHAGHEEGYLQVINVTWADTERGRGPAGTAIRTGETVVIRDTARDPRFAPWRAEALKRGYASSIGIPLMIGSDVLGALTIHASEPNAFDEGEVSLLRELANDLSYGVVTLRTRAERERAEEALRRAYDELERRVEERTAELSRTNTHLKQEIADRQRAEEALRTSERLYRLLTEGTRDAIVVADERGQIRLFNPAAQRTFGYEEREVLGGPLTVLMPPEYHAIHQQEVRRYVETRHSRFVGHTIERQGRRKSGEIFPLEISLSAIELPEGLIFLGAIRDLTERQRLQARVVQAEKLASLGLLSAGVAHEINNPLAYVANNLAVLERDFGGLSEVLATYEAARPALEAARPELAERIARIAEEIDLPYIRANLGRLLSSTRLGVKRVSDIVQNLRGFARLDQAAIDQMDAHEAIASSLEMIRGRLERRHIVVEQHFGELPRVVCAPAQIHQVILNLLVNAMQAIESTGRDGGRIEISTRACRDEVTLEIADDGCGIPAEVLPRIFDPFFTTKPIGQGTGLGLAISHGIVADHGGRIEVESIPGRGSRFRVILPVGGKGLDQEHGAPALPVDGGR